MKHGLLPQSGSSRLRAWLPLSWVSVLVLGLSTCFTLQAKTLFCPIQPNASNTSASCFLGNDGTASVAPTGGTAPYTINWSNGETGNSINGLSAGNYQYTITDAAGCSSNSNIYVGQATSIQANVSRVNNGCRFGTDGELSLAPSGGTPPYTYQWNNGANTATISGLAAGPYAYTITDANGCTRSGGVSVLANNPVVGNLTVRDVSCHGEAEGSAFLAPSGGVAPYSYAWSNGDNTQNISGLSAGNYSYTVTDAEGCTGEGSFAVQEPAPVWTTFTQQYACGDEDNGSAEIFANGGTPPYAYQWSNGATTAAINNLAPGMYFFTVTDSEGCESREGLVCIFRSILEVSVSANAPDCSSANDGSANLTVTDGISPITYQWSNGANTASVNNLAPGTYGYTVSGAFGCEVIGSVTIANAGTEVVAGATELANGNLQGSGSGGTAPYTYQWSNGETTAIATGYASGATYSLTVTDANGCFGIISGLVPDDETCPDNVTYAGMIGSDQYLCAPGNTPDLLVETDTPSGGTGTLEYIWMSSSSGGPFNPVTWFPIPNSNSPNYQPGPLDETTYFIRCVRREGCVYLESGLLTITVGDEIDPVIERPSLGCFGETQTYRVTNLPPFSTVNWEFTGPVTVNTTVGDEVEVTFIGGGYLDLAVTISSEDCTGTFTDRVTINGNCFGGGGESHQGNATAATTISAYPNPVSALTTLEFGTELAADAQIRVLSNTQQVIATYPVAAGTRRMDLQMSDLPAGLYLVQLLDGSNQPQVLKLMKN